MTNDTWPIRAPQPYLPCGSAVRLTALPHILAALTRMAGRQKERVGRWYRHRQTLKVLAKLDGHMLKDIGLPGGSGSIHAAAKALSARPAANENRHTRAA